MVHSKKTIITDFVKRIIISGVIGLFLGYVCYLFFSGKELVHIMYQTWNFFYFIELVILSLFLVIIFGIYPVYFKYIRVWICVLGLSLIVLGDTVFVNSAIDHMYLSDILKIFGVSLTFLAWTNILYTKKSRHISTEKKVEIIEV